MNIVIFGPPGAGKGTQSNFIVKNYNLIQLSTGDFLRKEIKEETKLGLKIKKIVDSGNLVSDEIVGELIEKTISNRSYKNRLIFDGYPRNISQAENLDKILKRYNQKISLVLRLKVSLETIKKRISGRSTCSTCGKIYNDFYNPPPKDSKCCSSNSLKKRSDDNVDVAIKRFKTYENETQPVLDYYDKYGLLKEINGENQINLIFKEISDIINVIEGWL